MNVIIVSGNADISKFVAYSVSLTKGAQQKSMVKTMNKRRGLHLLALQVLNALKETISG